ncbi:MAG: DNA-binding transcriptional LysR family regulator [Oleiphilaceae bacterium]|jgi:DNA-binding transcriptional LysR family regulator
MKFSLKQIEVFLATASCQNITQAAEQLSMSQSAASESLKTLENQFSMQLFDRIGKRLQLNDLGEIVKKQAKPFMERARVLEDALKQHTQLGSLKVGATLSIGNYLAINIISLFRDAYNGANATLEVANTTAIVNKVANFELDIGLIEGEVSHEDLDVTPWREDELVVFCSPNHPYATKRTLNDQQLTEAQWILRETGSGTRQAFDYAMHGLIPNLNVTLELQHTEAIKRAVEAGMGIGCLSKITLNDAFLRGNLVPIDIPHRNFYRQFYFIIHKDKYRSHAINSWLELCQTHFLS